MLSPLTKEDIVKLIPDLVLLEDGHLTWDQVGLLLNEDLLAVRSQHQKEEEGIVIPAAENPWRMVKEEMFLFAASSDPAYDALRHEMKLNGDAGPSYLLVLFCSWLSQKTGYPLHLMKAMTGAVLWGLDDPDADGWDEVRHLPVEIDLEGDSVFS